MDSLLVKQLANSFLKSEDAALAKYHPDLGWKAAKHFATRKEKFPLPMMGHDAKIFNTYMGLCNPFYLHDNIDLAINLSDCPTSSLALNCFLIQNQPYKWIAEYLNIPEESVIAYEKLFFNVIDRQGDKLYLAQIVYDKGRMEELMPGYFENTSLRKLALRAAYTTKDRDLTCYLLGTSNAKETKATLAKYQSQDLLESHITGAALSATKAGLMNQNVGSIAMMRELSVSSKRKPQKPAQHSDHIAAFVEKQWLETIEPHSGVGEFSDTPA